MRALKHLFPSSPRVEATPMEPEDVGAHLDEVKARLEATDPKVPGGKRRRILLEYLEEVYTGERDGISAYSALLTLAASGPPQAAHVLAHRESALETQALRFVETKGWDPSDVLSEMFSWNVRRVENNVYSVHYTIIFSLRSVRDVKPKIAARKVRNVDKPVIVSEEFPGETVGNVLCDKRFLFRTFREEVRRLVVDDVKGSDGYEDLRDLAVKLLRVRRRKVPKSRRKSFPPCMKELLKRAEEGENLPHEARFALASFLINIGWDVDKVVEVFSNVPDFDEDRTRYQVRHIAGLEGSGKRYRPPSCRKMKEWGLCVDGDCGVGSPLGYVFSRRGGRAGR